MKNEKIEIMDMGKKGQNKLLKIVLQKLYLLNMKRFFILQGDNFITIKKVDQPKPKEKFKSLALEIQKEVKSLKIKRAIVDEAISWARKK